MNISKKSLWKLTDERCGYDCTLLPILIYKILKMSCKLRTMVLYIIYKDIFNINKFCFFILSPINLSDGRNYDMSRVTSSIFQRTGVLCQVSVACYQTDNA